jgi:hypothetical protein
MCRIAFDARQMAADLGVALTVLLRRFRWRARLCVGTAQENFKKSSSKRITAVDNAIIVS